MTAPGPRRPSARARTTLLLAFLSLAAGCSPTAERLPPVLLDGAFSEWADATVVVEDAADAPRAAVDIRSIRGLDEAAWLFLSMDLGREVNAQSMPGTLHLLVDGDDDEATGTAMNGMRGVDLVVDLSHRQGSGRGVGFSMRAARPDGALETFSSYALGVTVAPTWAASRFELRISRLGATEVGPLAERIRLKAVYTEGEDALDETAVGSYAFRTVAEEAVPEPTDEWSTGPEGSVRVVAWNVSGGSFTANAEGFARVLAALEPDVLILDEVAGGITADAVQDFLSLEPMEELGSWHFVLGESGGRQRTVVAARDRAIRPAESMRRVDYGPGALEALAARLPAEAGRLVEIERERGLSATGAWIDMGGTEVLFVPVDLQSAGWAGSPQDLLRILQARTIRGHILEERGDARAPVIVGGDLNLVGSRDPLDTLIAHLDTDDSDLMMVDAKRLGERTHSTWRSADTPFAPGRLDFILVPDAAAEVVGSFVFGTEDLGRETLQRLGLEPELSERLSDHLPVVADLRFR
jgi:endonuclease/exonuclease/phosphatase family metal-dependent hydrolase